MSYPPAVRAAVLSAYASGMPQCLIMHHFGVTSKTLTAWRRAAGMACHRSLRARAASPPRVKPTEQTRQSVLFAYVSRMRLKRIVSTFGVSATTVYAWVAAAGLPLRRVAVISDEVVAAVIDAYVCSETSAAEICRTHGISMTSLYVILRRSVVPRRLESR